MSLAAYRGVRLLGAGFGINGLPPDEDSFLAFEDSLQILAGVVVIAAGNGIQGIVNRLLVFFVFNELDGAGLYAGLVFGLLGLRLKRIVKTGLDFLDLSGSR